MTPLDQIHAQIARHRARPAEAREWIIRCTSAELRAFAEELPASRRKKYLAAVERLRRVALSEHQEATLERASRRTEAASTKKQTKTTLDYSAVAAAAEPVHRKHRRWSPWRIAGEIASQINAGREQPLSQYVIRRHVCKYLHFATNPGRT